MSRQVTGLLDGAKAERARLRGIARNGDTGLLITDLEGEGTPPTAAADEPELHRVGALGGYKAERARLRQILNQNGLDALLEDLNSDN